MVFARRREIRILRCSVTKLAFGNWNRSFQLQERESRHCPASHHGDVVTLERSVASPVTAVKQPHQAAQENFVSCQKLTTTTAATATTTTTATTAAATTTTTAAATTSTAAAAATTPTTAAATFSAAAAQPNVTSNQHKSSDDTVKHFFSSVLT